MSVIVSIAYLSDLYPLAIDSWAETRESTLLVPQERASSDVCHVIMPFGKIREQAVGKLSRLFDAFTRWGGWHAQPHDVGTPVGQLIRNDIEPSLVGVGIGDDGRVRGVEVPRVLERRAQVDATVDE